MTATTPKDSSPRLRDLTGVWRRTLLIDDTGGRDDRSEVVWLQAGSCFVDLRRTAERPSFDGIACVADMTGTQREWAMSHQGFAGTLVTTDRAVEGQRSFEWQRSIDLHPPGPRPDAGRLRLESGQLVETGLYADYTEHWRREPAKTSPVWAMWLRDAEDRPALLVRVGDDFGWARGRLPHATAGTDFFDCEIALGRVTGATWRITASSLPFRAGDELAPKLAGRTVDRSRDGHVTDRSWQVESDEGDARL